MFDSSKTEYKLTKQTYLHSNPDGEIVHFEHEAFYEHALGAFPGGVSGSDDARGPYQQVAHLRTRVADNIVLVCAEYIWILDRLILLAVELNDYFRTFSLPNHPRDVQPALLCQNAVVAPFRQVDVRVLE